MTPLRCPECKQRYGLADGWGWHCFDCHRTWPLDATCHGCGSSQDRKWVGSVYSNTGSDSYGRRKKPPKRERDRLIVEYRNRCAYCLLPFGMVLDTPRGKLILTVAWDHFVPYSFSLRNEGDNWVPACQLCNGYKASKIFATFDEARAYIVARREEKGILTSGAKVCSACGRAHYARGLCERCYRAGRRERHSSDVLAPEESSAELQGQVSG